MNITLRQLYGFKAVADVGTFTAAAQRLKVAQPALSLNIRDLERELGARLFDRTTRRVELTAAGREFLQSVDKLIADLEPTAHVSAMYAPFLAVAIGFGAPPLLAALVLAYFSSLFASLTHFGTAPAPILFGGGHVSLGVWWKTGLILSFVNILIWLSVGGVWWKVLGLW